MTMQASVTHEAMSVVREKICRLVGMKQFGVGLQRELAHHLAREAIQEKKLFSSMAANAPR